MINDLLEVTATEATWGFNVGKVRLRTHKPDQCVGEVCVIHNPSDHHMVTWPMHWRADRRLMERKCPHGVGHPDPDGLAYEVKQGRTYQSVHGCDGCCSDV